jgi:glycosyltransferase involved in cell wall biosynthesis
MLSSKGALLCTVNFRANRGFAWDFIEGLYARMADHLAVHGIRTLVAYPSIPSAPRNLEGSAARPIVLDTELNTQESVRSTVELIRRENIREIYFTDRPARCWAYLQLRQAGVRRIIVHDHTSGERTPPHGLKRAGKWLLGRTPGIVADDVVAVSRYVARRHVEAGLIPPSRVVPVWNGLPVRANSTGAGLHARAVFDVAPGRPLIVCACRAAPEKGVVFLIRAFDRVARAGGRDGDKPVLLYLGDGPQLAELKELREGLLSKNDVILAGYRADAREILEGADLCVVPSVWQDAFPLGVLEAMAEGKPVIATRVGGIPEMIEHNVHGLLVPPADECALSLAIQELLVNRERATRLGVAARERVARQFTPEQQIRQLIQIVERGFMDPCGLSD